MQTEFDVVIVGGGMVGTVLACALGNSHLKVAVIEQFLPEPFTEGQPHDLRVSALSLASQKILSGIGAWKNISMDRRCPFRRMRVWETAGDTEFNSSSINYPELGFIVENRLIQLALLDRLRDFTNVELIAPTSIKHIDYSLADEHVVSLEGGRQLHARLLVGADGGNSKVRQLANIGTTSWDYNQHALVIYLETVYGQQDITWQRFVASGPQAFLPLTGNYASIVWYNSPDEVRRLQSLTSDALLAELKIAFPAELGEIKQIINRGSFPLKRLHAHRYVKQGVALVGDAAHMINPLAGQGVNIGFLDAAALAETLLKARRDCNIADVNFLKNYETMRRNENLKMMTVMDTFYRVFSNDVAVLKFVRNLGLGLAERLTPAKTKVMKMAMGLEGNLPALAKGQPIK